MISFHYSVLLLNIMCYSSSVSFVDECNGREMYARSIMLLFFDAIHALLVPLRLTQLSLMLECAIECCALGCVYSHI